MAHPCNLYYPYLRNPQGKSHEAVTHSGDRSTIINMSNHVYFNLAGHSSGWEGLKEHKLTINAETFTPDDEQYLPTGKHLK